MLDLLSWKRAVLMRFRGCDLLLAEYFSKCVCVLNSLRCSHQLACTRESKKIHVTYGSIHSMWYICSCIPRPLAEEQGEKTL